MAEKVRQYHKGFWYHVYARGLQEVPLFVSDDERIWFIEKIDEVFIRRQIKLGALSLMGTHYHMLLKMGPVSLDKALNGLHMTYSHVNKKRARCGPLFRSRPGADIILNDSYLQQLVSYIHYNAVKAGLVRKPCNYKWHTDEIYRTGKWKHGSLQCWEFPPYFKDRDRTKIYKDLMEEEVDCPDSRRGYIGAKNEWDKIQRRNNSRKERFLDRRNRKTMEEIAGVKAKEGNITVKILKRRGRSQPVANMRQEAMVEMYEQGYGPTEIGEYFNRSKSTVMHAINRKK